uniref:BTB/POZ domain-containing protein 6 n=1 Tax=Cacopsylla melanoneura TaxID=428564 RepID=A0A8D8V6N3_9HEMI
MTLKMVNGKLLFNYCEHDILKTMYNNEDFCDMAFIVDSTRIPVNRAIISAASSVFKTMLLGSFQDANREEIEIPEIGKEAFHHFVKYMYGYSIQLDALELDSVLDILKLSDFYDLPNLFEALKACISKCPLTTIYTLIFPKTGNEEKQNLSVKLINTAFTYDMVDMCDKIKAIIQYSSDSINKFFNHPQFVNLTQNVLLEFLRSDHFNTEEIVILKGVLKWIEFNESTDESNCDTLDPNWETSQEKRKMSSEDETTSCTKRRRMDSGHTLADYNSDKDGNVSKDVESNEKSVETKVKGIDTSRVETLLNEIRWPYMSLSEYSKFMKYDPLFKKYEKFLDSSNWCKHNNYKPRKQMHCKRIEMYCETNFEAKSEPGSTRNVPSYDDLEAYSYSYTVKNDKFHLKVFYCYDEAKIEIKLFQEKVQCVVEDCTSIAYSLVLKSMDPFKSDHVLVNKQILHSLFTEKSENYLKQKSFHPIESYCSYNNNKFHILSLKNDTNPCHICDLHLTDNKQLCIDTFILSTELLNSDPKFIEDNYYKLEAVIEYID